jgi:hypothetical protein
MAESEAKSFNTPDETRTFDKGKVDLLKLSGGVVGLGVLQPGWKWSECVKPIAKTDLCEAPHSQYTVSGRLHIVMADGKEFELGPGDVGIIPPGHDAWVVGNEPYVGVDWSGMEHYAERR